MGSMSDATMIVGCQMHLFSNLLGMEGRRKHMLNLATTRRLTGVTTATTATPNRPYRSFSLTSRVGVRCLSSNPQTRERALLRHTRVFGNNNNTRWCPESHCCNHADSQYQTPRMQLRCTVLHKSELTLGCARTLATVRVYAQQYSTMQGKNAKADFLSESIHNTTVIVLSFTEALASCACATNGFC